MGMEERIAVSEGQMGRICKTWEQISVIWQHTINHLLSKQRSLDSHPGRNTKSKKVFIIHKWNLTWFRDIRHNISSDGKSYILKEVLL